MNRRPRRSELKFAILICSAFRIEHPHRTRFGEISFLKLRPSRTDFSAHRSLQPITTHAREFRGPDDLADFLQSFVFLHGVYTHFSELTAGRK